MPITQDKEGWNIKTVDKMKWDYSLLFMTTTLKLQMKILIYHVKGLIPQTLMIIKLSISEIHCLKKKTKFSLSESNMKLQDMVLLNVCNWKSSHLTEQLIFTKAKVLLFFQIIFKQELVSAASFLSS